MEVYEYRDYKRFLADLIASMPKRGRGQARKLAEHLSVHSVVVSQILSGARDFTHEQSLEVAGFFGFDERSTEYFVTLVLRARAGTKRLESHLDKKLAALREEAMTLKNRMPKHKTLTETERAVFYSNWLYSGVRLLTAIPGYDNPETIAEYFGISRAKAQSTLDFLVDHGLCQKNEKGQITVTPVATFIDSSSPFILNLHRNWRLKSLEKMQVRKEHDFYYSAPLPISLEAKKALREEIVKFVSEFNKRLVGVKREQLSCLNIDWFDF